MTPTVITSFRHSTSVHAIKAAWKDLRYTHVPFDTRSHNPWFLAGWRIELDPAVNAWCEENIRRSYDVRDDGLWFADEADAAMFKLWWC